MQLPRAKFTLFMMLQFLLLLNAFFFIAQQISILSFLHWFSGNHFFYVSLPTLALLIGLSLWQKHRSFSLSFLGILLIAFLPVSTVICIGLFVSHNFHFTVFLGFGIYVISWFGYIAALYIQKQQTESLQTAPIPTVRVWEPLSWKQPVNRFPLLAVITLTLFFFGFGLHHLAHFAAIDEPLWLDGRIGKYWKNLSEHRMDKTLISDKPGITLAWISGPGLLTVTPKEYRETRFDFQAKNPDLRIEDYFFAFRFPLLLSVTLLLPLFYVLLVPLIGRSAALFGYVGIALSPPLIGMSKIVNPDSLLWIFAPLSFLAYLVFLEKKVWRFLIVSGVLLGLALLTKYVANFLLVYFFGFIFLHALWKKTLDPISIRHSLRAFLIWIGIGLSVLYFFVPLFWIQPFELLTSTLFSQAFEKVAWLFLGLIGLVLIDHTYLKSYLTLACIRYLKQLEEWLAPTILIFFSGCLSVVILNGMFGMPFFDFMEILASPKSAYRVSTTLSIFLTHFYPLIFGIPPIILLGSFLLLWKTGRNKLFQETIFGRITLSVVLFILLFYLGSTVNHVVLINRYQIMLYPLLTLLGGIGIFCLAQSIQERVRANKRLSWTIPLWFIFILVSGMLMLSPLITPFPLSYASILLPKTLATDVKDMGAGSYEAAQYLNTLPEAPHTAIWTDKSGVCKFYIGPCYGGLSFRNVEEHGIRYFVLSSGRASRTGRFFLRESLANDTNLLRLDDYYARQDALYELNINGRSGQSVKIFTALP